MTKPQHVPKAEHILQLYKYDATAGHPTPRRRLTTKEAQAALCSDLLATLPEKKPETEGKQHYCFNDAIDQMEQAIKAYFGEGE